MRSIRVIKREEKVKKVTIFRKAEPTPKDVAKMVESWIVKFLIAKRSQENAGRFYSCNVAPSSR
jgi:hypothetical protein